MSVSWKAVRDFEGLYEVSDCGDVRSIRWGRKRELAPTPRGDVGYRMVTLCKNGTPSNHYVHRLVLEAFVGPAPPGYQSCHFNGHRFDNRLENLRWDTPRGNKADSARHGTISRGSSRPNSKLTEEDIPYIRERHLMGESARSIAKNFGVSARLILDVVARIVWRHI